jgi:uncharacterized protein (TIGR02099 family)
VTETPPSLPARLLRRLWRWFAVVFATTVLLAATAVGLFRVLVPMAPSYLMEVEALAGAALGVRVTVARMDLRWHLAGPALRLEGVALYEPTSARQLAIAGEIDIGIDALSALLDRELTPRWAHVSGLELEMGRDTEGRIIVGGGPIPVPETPRRPLPENFDLEIEASTISWQDAALEQVPFVARGVSAHAELETGSARFSAQIPLPGSPADPAHVIGAWEAAGEDAGLSVTIVGQNLDLSALGAWAATGPVEIDRGTGDLRLRIDLAADGVLSLLETEADLSDVAILVQRDEIEQQLSLAQLSGTLRWRRGATGWQLSTEAMRLVHRDRVHAPTNLTLDFEDDPIRSRTQMALAADVLPLDELALAAGFADPEWAERIATFEPRGTLQEVDLRIELDDGDVALTSFTGQFQDLGWTAVDAIPGIGGLDGGFRMGALGGEVELDARDVHFDAPNLFRNHLRVQRAAATVSVLRDGDALTLRATDVDIFNADGQVTGRASIALLDPDAGPDLDIELQLVRGDLSAKSDYLPAGIMPEAVVAWLDRGVISGRVPRAEITLRGPARTYPYRDGSGVFLIRFDYQDAVLDFAEGWPIATGLAGEAIFEGPSLTVTADRGGWEGIQLRQSRALIPDLPVGHLSVSADADPDLAAVLEFVRHSPLAQRFGAYLDAASGTGSTIAGVTLDIPLGNPDELALAGDIALIDASLTLSDGRIPLRSVDGSIGFTRDTFVGRGIDVMLWDNPAVLEIQPDPEGGSRLTALGVMRLLDLPEDLRSNDLLSNLDGSLDWRLDASFPADPREDAAPRQVILRSDLVGVAMDLPSPFSKPSDESRDTVVTVASPRPGSMETRLIQAGHVGATALWQDSDGWGLDRAHLRLGGGLPAMPADGGIWVSGRTDRVDADAWWSLAGQTDDDGGPGLESLSLAIGELAVMGQRYSDTRLNLDRVEEGWLLRMDGAEASGSVRVPERTPDGPPIVADFEHLSLTTGEPGDPPDPRELPAVRLSVQDLSINDAHWGGITVLLDRIPAGLTLSEFRMQADSYALIGTGGWIVDENEHYSQVEFQIESTDVAATMSRFGFSQGVTGNNGQVDAQINWRGVLFQPALARLDGTAQIRVEDGMVNEVSPGAGRLFGLLSINALQRRLLLDFSDLFGRGLAFDQITASYRIEQGDAYTEDLLLLGPGLDVGIAGRTGLAARDYDQQVLVNAKLGNALPIAGALAGGPVVGAALLVFSRLFRDELRESTQVQYQVTGSWDDPLVEQVETTLTTSPAPEDD